ncbi:MAG: ABC transporter ATP-binding protein [Planctomycetota bacterium]
MLEIKQISKKYGSFQALSNISFSLAEGEIFGLLGANGSGKSTLNKIIVGLLRPNEGVVLIEGQSLHQHRELLQSIGYLPELIYLYPEMTGSEFLFFVAGLKKIKQPEKQIQKMLDYFGLRESQDIFLSAYSMGMRKKIGLSAALLGNPSILLLDEPTNGLDPVSIYLFREIVQELKRNRKTVLISSHILEFIEKSCDRVGIIESGKLVAIGTLPALQEQAKRPQADLEQLFMHFTGKTIAPVEKLFE